jgi:hypothetical protein
MERQRGRPRREQQKALASLHLLTRSSKKENDRTKTCPNISSNCWAIAFHETIEGNQGQFLTVPPALLLRCQERYFHRRRDP